MTAIPLDDGDSPPLPPPGSSHCIPGGPSGPPSTRDVRVDGQRLAWTSEVFLCVPQPALSDPELARGESNGCPAVVKGFAFPIPAMTCDDGDPGDRRVSRHPSPSHTIPDWRGFERGHPKSSQIGVAFSVLAFFRSRAMTRDVGDHGDDHPSPLASTRIPKHLQAISQVIPDWRGFDAYRGHLAWVSRFRAMANFQRS
jgi:hypothetical protein